MWKKAIRWIDQHLEDRIILTLYIVMVLMLSVEVAKRYLFKSSSPYVPELATVMFLWIVFLGMSYGVKLRAHIVIDVLPIRSPLINLIFEIVSNVVTALVMGALIYYAYDVLSFMRRLDMRMDATGLPTVYFMSISLVSFAATIVRLTQNTVQSIRSYRLRDAMPKEEPA